MVKSILSIHSDSRFIDKNTLIILVIINISIFHGHCFEFDYEDRHFKISIYRYKDSSGKPFNY